MRAYAAMEVSRSEAAWRGLTVLDVRGRLVRILARDSIAPGTTRWMWDGRDEHGAPVATGVYFVLAQGQHIRAMHRVVLLK